MSVRFTKWVLSAAMIFTTTSALAGLENTFLYRNAAGNSIEVEFTPNNELKIDVAVTTVRGREIHITGSAFRPVGHYAEYKAEDCRLELTIKGDDSETIEIKQDENTSCGLGYGENAATATGIYSLVTK